MNNFNKIFQLICLHDLSTDHLYYGLKMLVTLIDYLLSTPQTKMDRWIGFDSLHLATTVKILSRSKKSLFFFCKTYIFLNYLILFSFCRLIMGKQSQRLIILENTIERKILFLYKKDVKFGHYLKKPTYYIFSKIKDKSWLAIGQKCFRKTALKNDFFYSL